jgi:hypothetical protein
MNKETNIFITFHPVLSKSLFILCQPQSLRLAIYYGSLSYNLPGIYFFQDLLGTNPKKATLSFWLIAPRGDSLLPIFERQMGHTVDMEQPWGRTRLEQSG